MQKMNTEFNYRYQVKGDTPWERIKVLKGFLEGRKRIEEVRPLNKIKQEATKAELEHARKNGALPHVLMRLEAEVAEIEVFRKTEDEGEILNKQEIQIIEKLLSELYEIVEPTRAKHDDDTPYTDEEMFELNAANEFTAMIGKQMYAEIIVHGKPSPEKLLNAMSNPYTFNALKKAGLIPSEAQRIEGGANPMKIELNMQVYEKIEPPVPTILQLEELINKKQ